MRSQSRRPHRAATFGAAALLMLSCVGFSLCPGDTSTTAQPIGLPREIAGCFSQNTPITVSGTYAIAGISKTVRRPGTVSDLGRKFEVAEDGDDDLHDQAVASEHWKGPLVAAPRVEPPSDPPCFTLSYRGEPYSIAGDSGCRIEANGTVCPGPPCTVERGEWSIRCEDGRPLANGSWTMP